MIHEQYRQYRDNEITLSRMQSVKVNSYTKFVDQIFQYNLIYYKHEMKLSLIYGYVLVTLKYYVRK